MFLFLRLFEKVGRELALVARIETLTTVMTSTRRVHQLAWGAGAPQTYLVREELCAARVVDQHQAAGEQCYVSLHDCPVPEKSPQSFGGSRAARSLDERNSDRTT